MRIAFRALAPRRGSPPDDDRRDTERTVIEVEDVGVEAEGIQECGVHEPILPSPRHESRGVPRRRANLLPHITRCHHRRVSSTCQVNCRGGLLFQPCMHRPPGSRQSPGQSPAQCRQCLVCLTSAMRHMIGGAGIRTTK